MSLGWSLGKVQADGNDTLAIHLLDVQASAMNLDLITDNGRATYRWVAIAVVLVAGVIGVLGAALCG